MLEAQFLKGLREILLRHVNRRNSVLIGVMSAVGVLLNRNQIQGVPRF
jgi:hypothetical protein